MPRISRRNGRKKTSKKRFSRRSIKQKKSTRKGGSQEIFVKGDRVKDRRGNMFGTIHEVYSPTNIAVVWDSLGGTADDALTVYGIRAEDLVLQFD